MSREVFENERFLHDHGSFPQLRKFSTSKYFSTIKEVFHDQESFHKQWFFLYQGFFLQENLKPWAKIFNTLIPGGNKISYVLTQTRIYRFV